MLSEFEEQSVSNIDFKGDTKQLIKISLVTTVLTLVTLGIYRFWARTRIRRYFWSAVTLDGYGFEYTGRGIEKLIGFLIAVAILAVYLGIFQLFLSFAGMSLFNLGGTDTDQLQVLLLPYITFLALLPLIFYAQYRARRYVLSRTKWKGIRFGAEQAAWGYCLRAIGHSLITVLTLGILLPRQTFYLEKYKADRTWFGDLQFSQGGKWTRLYPAMKHIGLGLALSIPGGILIGIFHESGGPEIPSVIGACLGIVGVIWFLFGVLYYILHSHRILTHYKTLGEEIRFTSKPQVGYILPIYLFCPLLISTIASLIAVIAGGIIFAPIYFIFGISLEISFVIGAVVFYVIFFLAYIVISMVMLTKPVVSHFAKVTAVYNLGALAQAKQREGDEMIEAEGFADALDVGAGF